jgi:UDP-N-acetyl-D-mannosaminuronate dehydrogenase
MAEGDIFDICVIGGAGHVGLPLSIQFANHGKKVCVYDINPDSLTLIERGTMPFKEKGAEPLLKKALKEKSLSVSLNAEVISLSRIVIMVVGTPVDEFLNPKTGDLFKILEKYLNFFKPGQLLVLRSTVYPGTSRNIYNYLRNNGKDMGVAFCPERIAEGYAIEELVKLPQIVSSFYRRRT